MQYSGHLGMIHRLSSGQVFI